MIKRFLVVLLSALIVNVAYAEIKPRFADGTSYAKRQDKIRRHARMQARQPKGGVIGSQGTASVKSIGRPKIPVVLVEFLDWKFSCACSGAIDNPDSIRRYFDMHFNGDGSGSLYRGSGSWGSVSEYYRDQSYGKFEPEFVMIGPVTLNESYAYYGKNQGYEDSEVVDININIYNRELTQKAQTWFIQAGMDWSEFDNDGDGVVDILYSIYAGFGENGDDDVNTIWPKNCHGTYEVNGIKYGGYVCSNEVYQQVGNCDGIGVICHEFSHAMGLPDFYDVNYIAYGLDYWDIMDSGCYCYNGYRPCGYSAYEREFMGWRDMVTLEAGVDRTVTAYPMTTDEGYGYKIVNPAADNEYYILENRQASPAGWDTNIGRGKKEMGYHSGLLITHVHYLKSRWEGNTVNTVTDHQLMTIMPADGSLDSYMWLGEGIYTAEYLFESADGDLYPGCKNVHDFKGEQQTIYIGGDYMNQPVTDITQNTDGSISFNFCDGAIVAVDAPEMSGRTAQVRAYNIQGQPVNADFGQLHKGVYVINGRKVLVK